MVGKGKATGGSAQAIDYILNDKGKAVEVSRNMLGGENGAEILAELRNTQQSNTRCENNVYSFVVSPDPNQKKFTMPELADLTKDVLKRLGLEDHQYIATVHNSTKTQHIHIICNRINHEGKAHKDHHIDKQLHHVLEKIAVEKGLKTAKEVSVEKGEATKDIRKEIKIAYLQCASKATSLHEMNHLMQSKGYEFALKMKRNTNDEVQGFRIEDKISGQSFKASEIGSEVRYHALIAQINQNQLERKKLMLKTIEKSINIEKRRCLSLQEFKEALEKNVPGLKVELIKEDEGFRTFSINLTLNGSQFIYQDVEGLRKTLNENIERQRPKEAFEIKQAYLECKGTASSIEDFSSKMKEKGFEIKLTINKGEVEGFSIEVPDTKQSFECDQSIYNDLKAQINKNQIENQPFRIEIDKDDEIERGRGMRM